jgi:hypothetical protein
MVIIWAVPLAVTGALCLCGLMIAVEHLSDIGPVMVFWRLLTGHHLDGKPRNNRTWLRPATRPLGGPADRPMSWLERRPRAHRAAVAWLFVLVIPWTAYGLWEARAATIACLEAGAAITMVICVFRGLRWAARRHHRNHVVRPLAVAAAVKLKVSPAVVAENLKIKPRRSDARPGEPVLIYRQLPDQLAATGSERAWLEQLFTSRLGPMRFDWQTWKYPMQLVGLAAAAPPELVTAGDWLPLIDSLGWSQYFLGCAADAEPQIWDGSEEDPHVMMGGKPRRGKTNLNLAVAAQGLRRGELFDGIDHKRISLTCLAGVPGFRLACDPGNVPQMWALIRAFRQCMDAAKRGQGCGAPHTLIIEEINQAFALFRGFWETQGGHRRVTDVPAWQDVMAVLHEGPQFHHRVLLGGQDLKDNVLFGSRHSFGTALMAGFTPRQWGYTVGSLPVPPAPTRRGRFYLARGHDDPVLMQAVIADPRGGPANERAWRAFALDGGQGPGGEQGEPWRAWCHRPPPAPKAAIGTAARPELERVLVGPKAAAAYLRGRGHASMSQPAFAAARRRHPIPGEFTHQVRGQEWTSWPGGQLAEWARNLP